VATRKTTGKNLAGSPKRGRFSFINGFEDSSREGCCIVQYDGGSLLLSRVALFATLLATLTTSTEFVNEELIASATYKKADPRKKQGAAIVLNNAATFS
jgi:hypothetical protein